MTRQQIADKLKEIRIERGISQVELSKLLGIDAGTISKIEKGKSNIGLDTLHAFSKALNFDIKLITNDPLI